MPEKYTLMKYNIQSMIVTYAFSLIVSSLTVGLPDLARHCALALADHDEVLETQLLLVGEASGVALVLEALLLAAVEHVHDAVDLGGLLSSRGGGQGSRLDGVVHQHGVLVVLLIGLALPLQCRAGVDHLRGLLATVLGVQRTGGLGGAKLLQEGEVGVSEHSARIEAAAHNAGIARTLNALGSGCDIFVVFLLILIVGAFVRPLLALVGYADPLAFTLTIFLLFLFVTLFIAAAVLSVRIISFLAFLLFVLIFGVFVFVPDNLVLKNNGKQGVQLPNIK